MKFIDKREDTTPTFGSLHVGDLFTNTDGKFVFIKTEIRYDDHKDPYNTVSIDGEFYWSDDHEEIRPIQEIEIIIKG